MNSLEVSTSYSIANLLTPDRQHWLPSLENCESMIAEDFNQRVRVFDGFMNQETTMLWVVLSLTGSSFYLSSLVGPSVCRPLRKQKHPGGRIGGGRFSVPDFSRSPKRRCFFMFFLGPHYQFASLACDS